MACLCHQPVTSTLSASPFMKGIERKDREKETKKKMEKLVLR
jgi:hypothetical protein